MHASLGRLRDNVAAGSRLARFRPVSVQDFHISTGQLILLVAFALLVTFCCDWLESLPAPVYNETGLAMEGFSTLMLLFAATLTALWPARWTTPLALAVMVFATMPFLLVVVTAITLFSYQVPDQAWWVQSGAYLICLAVILAAITRPAMLNGGMRRLKGAGIAAIYLGIWLIPSWYLAPSSYFWYRDFSSGGNVDEYAAYRDLDVEALYYRQPALMDTHLGQLLPQRPGMDDLYFVGFAGHAYQDVFLKEITYARDLFDRRFDTAGRSLLLVNHLSTRDSLPIASRSNLQVALSAIGRRIDADNDLLIMFLTSHGSAQELSVDYWTLGLNDLTPAQLRADLDAAGIRWRVIMVSACHSGAFIEALRDPYTMVLTAAASDRTSFGCGNDFDMTYFGEALLKHQLSSTRSFENAFAAAAAELAAREQAEGLEPSRPQIFVGEKIRGKLTTLADTLETRIDSDRPQHNFAFSAHDRPATLD